VSERPRFRDAALDERYERDGYVLVPAAAREQVAALRASYRRLVRRTPRGFHSTPYSQDATLKRAVNDDIQRLLRPAVDALLTDVRPLLGSFITKGRGDDGKMPPHMDWTFVEEPAATSMNFWVPLVDVGHRNGAMSVLPRGQLVPHTIRGSGTSNPFCNIEAAAQGHMVEVPMAAGDVLIHDHRLLHASPPNRSLRPRVVAGCALVGAHTPAVHYRQSGPGELTRHELEDRFFTDYTFGDTDMPPSARATGTVRFENPELVEDDLPRPVPGEHVP
jgi:hypothetical protein